MDDPADSFDNAKRARAHFAKYKGFLRKYNKDFCSKDCLREYEVEYIETTYALIPKEYNSIDEAIEAGFTNYHTAKGKFEAERMLISCNNYQDWFHIVPIELKNESSTQVRKSKES